MFSQTWPAKVLRKQQTDFPTYRFEQSTLTPSKDMMHTRFRDQTYFIAAQQAGTLVDILTHEVSSFMRLGLLKGLTDNSLHIPVTGGLLLLNRHLI